MLRPKRVKNGTVGSGRISSILLVGWLITAWSRPAFPDEGRHLTLAPVRFGSDVGGNIGYTYQSNSYGTSHIALQSLGAQVFYKARVSSYFWQPWFAQVSAGLGVDFFSSITRTPPASAKGENTLVTDEATLDLVKYSRFPFKAHVFSSKSRANGNTSGINSEYKNSGYDLTQQYKTLRGDFSSVAYYIHSKGGRADFGIEEISDSLNINLTGQPYIHQSYTIVGDFKNISHPVKDDKVRTDLVTANHLYQPNSTFSIGTLVNLIKTGFTLNSSSVALQQTDYNSQQMSSYASWRPIRSALTVTSGVRLFRSELKGGNSPFRNDDTNFNLGANYAWSRLLRTYGSVNVNDSGGIQTVSTNAALSASKMFGENEAVKLGDFSYTRYAGASISNSTVTTTNKNATATSGSGNTSTSSVQSLGGNLGHSLDKSSDLGGGRLSINLFQRWSEVLSSRNTPSARLSSGGSLLWRRSEGRESTIMSLRVTDSRQLTGNQYFSQLINLQASRNVRLLHHQTMIGNLTIQTSRSGLRGETTPFITTPSANLQYINERLFSVRNLNFNSNLAITGREIVSSQTSNPLNLSGASSASVAWNNDLDYFIGRLEVKLHSQIAEVNNVRQTMLFFNIKRSF